MIKFENVKTVGWENAIRGMRNPKNSWDRSDSSTTCGDQPCTKIDGCDLCCNIPHFTVGKKDHDLMQCLANAGPVHAKYRRMIVVYADITAPLYWWKEFDTYKVGTVSNSCSTMHKIHDKEFTLDDFSHEKLGSEDDHEEVEGAFITGPEEGYLHFYPKEVLEFTIDAMNVCRAKFLETNNKTYWWQMIQLLPSSYNQKRTIMMSYEVLANINNWRTNHKLDEWVAFCEWSRTLPCAGIFSVQKQEEDLK